MTLVDSRPGHPGDPRRAGRRDRRRRSPADDMLDALLRRNLDLEFGDRFARRPTPARWADRFRELYVEFGVPGTDAPAGRE